jgi:hypothetical protein
MQPGGWKHCVSGLFSARHCLYILHCALQKGFNGIFILSSGLQNGFQQGMMSFDPPAICKKISNRENKGKFLLVNWITKESGSKQRRVLVGYGGLFPPTLERDLCPTMQKQCTPDFFVTLDKLVPLRKRVLPSQAPQTSPISGDIANVGNWILYQQSSVACKWS